VGGFDWRYKKRGRIRAEVRDYFLRGSDKRNAAFGKNL